MFFLRIPYGFRKERLYWTGMEENAGIVVELNV